MAEIEVVARTVDDELIRIIFDDDNVQNRRFARHLVCGTALRSKGYHACGAVYRDWELDLSYFPTEPGEESALERVKREDFVKTYKGSFNNKRDYKVILSEER